MICSSSDDYDVNVLIQTIPPKLQEICPNFNYSKILLGFQFQMFDFSNEQKQLKKTQKHIHEHKLSFRTEKELYTYIFKTLTPTERTLIKVSNEKEILERIVYSHPEIMI